MTEHYVTNMGQLEAMYAQPMENSLLKELDHIGSHYRALIESFRANRARLSCEPEGYSAEKRKGNVRILASRASVEFVTNLALVGRDRAAAAAAAI